MPIIQVHESGNHDWLQSSFQCIYDYVTHVAIIVQYKQDDKSWCTEASTLAKWWASVLFQTMMLTQRNNICGIISKHISRYSIDNTQTETDGLAMTDKQVNMNNLLPG